jgi:hypothetical protein
MVFDLPVVGEKFRPLRNFSPKFEEEGLYNAELYEAEATGVSKKSEKLGALW